MPVLTFKSDDDSGFYEKLYQDKLNHFSYFLDCTIHRILGERYQAENLSGELLKQMVDITESLLYETNSEFRQTKPEYQRDWLHKVLGDEPLTD